MSEEEKKKATPTADSPSSGPDISKSMRSESILAFVACILLVLAALSSVSSQLNLSPVYGSIPAARYHYRGITITALLALGSGPYVQKWLPFGARPWIPVVAFWIPVIQCVLFSYSGQLGPLGGPIATESLTYFPLLFLAMSAAITTFESFDMSELSSAIADTIPAVLSYIVFSAGKQSFDAFLPPLIGRSALLTRSGLQTALACAFTVLAPSKLILLAIPAIIHSAWMNPHGVSNQATALLNSTLQQHHYTLIERKESLTGYVSVLESHENQFLVLRCDHSLLGGDWLVTEKSRKRGQRKRETVYSVFTMLESVRLVEGAESRNDADSSALFIGLGIGTSPKAFIEHGINTTVVELDAVVYQFARKYFELPPNHNAIIQDALPFVDHTSKSQPASFDYIVHDVFTGGAEPTPLFTFEFLSGLNLLLKHDGVIAINYAADLNLPPAKMVLRTIHAVFPTCRIFQDQPPEDNNGTTFVNMIVFCTKQPGGTLTFREPVEADFAGSLARRQWIPPKSKQEIQYASIVSEQDAEDVELILHKGQEQKLEKYHPESAAKHWEIMRTVMPAAVWELW